MYTVRCGPITVETVPSKPEEDLVVDTCPLAECRLLFTCVQPETLFPLPNKNAFVVSKCVCDRGAYGALPGE